MNQYLMLIVVCALVSCAGTDHHKNLTISTRNLACDVRLKKKYHDVWFALHNEDAPDAKIGVKAWATNLGDDVIKTRYEVFERSTSENGPSTPAYQEPLEIESGERRLFFVGPIHLLGMSFMEHPQSGDKLRIEVLLDEAPNAPLHGSFASTWGGP